MTTTTTTRPLTHGGRRPGARPPPLQTPRCPLLPPRLFLSRSPLASSRQQRHRRSPSSTRPPPLTNVELPTYSSRRRPVSSPPCDSPSRWKGRFPLSLPLCRRSDVASLNVIYVPSRRSRPRSYFVVRQRGVSWDDVRKPRTSSRRSRQQPIGRVPTAVRLRYKPGRKKAADLFNFCHQGRRCGLLSRFTRGHAWPAFSRRRSPTCGNSTVGKEPRSRRSGGPVPLLRRSFRIGFAVVDQGRRCDVASPVWSGLRVEQNVEGPPNLQTSTTLRAR